MLVLGTDPVSVLTVLARVGDEGGLDGSVLGRWVYRAEVVDLATLAMMLDLREAFTSWRLDDDDAERVILALHESRVYGRPFYRWGHSSVIAARNLLQFEGDCHRLAGHPLPSLPHAHARRRVHLVRRLPVRTESGMSPLRRTPHADDRVRHADGPTVVGAVAEDRWVLRQGREVPLRGVRLRMVMNWPIAIA